MTEYHFGISIVSLLPHSMDWELWHGSPSNAAYRAIENGAEFLQTAPLRGVNPADWYCQSEWSWYKEDAWNAVDGFWQALFRRDGDNMEPSTLTDWGLFPDPYEAGRVFERLAGRHVSHEFGEDWNDRLVEIKPEHWLSPYDLAYKAWSEGYGLVIDTRHLLRQPRNYDEWFDGPHPFGRTIAERIAAIDYFAPWVQLVHLKGVDGLHEQVVRRLLQSPRLQPRIDVVAEFIPSMHWTEDQTFTYAKQFLARAKWLFGQAA